MSPTLFRLPFPRGAVAVLHQGNKTEAPLSHSESNCLHALDFASLNEAIVAAASGKVVQLFTTAVEGDNQAGYGFGNFVKILHSDNTCTFYSHLKSVSVQTGEEVKSGQQLGVMGATGWTGCKHLHFSRHQSPICDTGVEDTIPFEMVLTADNPEDPEFKTFGSEDLKDYRFDPARQGFLYCSENSPDSPPPMGHCPADLRSEIRNNAQRLAELLKTKARGDWTI